MSSIVQRVETLKLGHPPAFLANNLHYETMMGSVAYGVSSDTSDVDVYGFCVPPKTLVFPHLAGEIYGFGRQKKRFDQWQQHHIEDREKNKSYDISIYSIVKYFSLCMENNPNMIDSLFTPECCVLHITEVGQMVRDNRRIFLHKGAWHKFRGYAYSQLHKANIKNPEGKRKETVDEFGYDPKYVYHLVRLLDEIEQILQFGDINLLRAKEQLKAIRRGDSSLTDARQWFTEKEADLDRLYQESTLSDKPDEDRIKELLINCLEHHYGNLSDAVVVEGRYIGALKRIRGLLEEVGL